jgi:hypothetical protein
MKNVTKILTVVTLCATLFGSAQRIGALGGNAALWPGDEANIAAFPAQVNNHAYLQLTGVGADTDSEHASLLFQKDTTTWGFNYGSGDWVNMHYGDGSMGLTVGFSNNDDGAGTTSSDMSVAYGNTFDWGEIGVQYMTANDGGDTMMNLHYRTDFGFWLFDNTVVSVHNLVCDLEDGSACDMLIDADFWTAMDVGGADLVYAWGIVQGGNDGVLHQTATLGVEANMTDWATLRAGYNWAYQISGDNDVVGVGQSDFTYGLGFNWGGMTADFTVNSALLLDPVGTITGYGDGGLTTDTITLTYSF